LGFVAKVLVEPAAFTRVFDLDYQAERFAVYHQHAIVRWTHYVCTPVILGVSLWLVGRVVGWPAEALGFLALVAWYARLHPVVGALAAAELLAFAGLAHAAAGWGFDTRHAVAALAVGSVVSNLSHAVEPVPPALTGRGFEPFAVYWARTPARERAELLLMNLFYAPLELVSAPRLFAVHVVRSLHRLGWRPDWGLDVEARALGARGAVAGVVGA
jgi:hypothetical protein